MSGSQHKKQEKARRRAEREAAKKAERRRNVMTGIIAAAIVLVGGVLVALSVDRPEEIDLEAIASEAEAQASELLASEGVPTPGASEPGASELPEGTLSIPDDPSAEPGAPVDSGEPGQVDDRPVACDAEEPANAADSRPQYPGGPADVLEEGVDYVAVIETSCGTVEIDLLEADAPATVNSFVFLAREGFFDGLEMFRNATSIAALQTGGGNQTNSWSIGYTLPDELGLAEAEGYPAGVVAMAKTAAPNSAGSQFFFVYGDAFDAAFADNRTYPVFARTLEGLDVVEEIAAIEVDGETPRERVYMESVTIEER